MDKLKPCPFCGEEDDIHSYTDEVICGSCGCHVGSMHKTKEINAEIWNTRSQAEIDAYKQDLERTIAEKVEMQAEIDKLKSDIEIMIQKAASKHRPAYDEQQKRIMNMQAEIDELKCELTILLKLSTVNMTDDHVKRVNRLL